MTFKEAVEEFDRMCEFYDDETENPFYEETGSDEWEEWWIWGIYNPEEFVKVIEKFSHDHPRPIYPTIGELVHYIIMKHPELRNLSVEKVMEYRLPMDIAKEWGIVPINECGLTKYCNK